MPLHFHYVSWIGRGGKPPTHGVLENRGERRFVGFFLHSPVHPIHRVHSADVVRLTGWGTSSGGVWRYSLTPEPVFCSIRQVDEEMNCQRSVCQLSIQTYSVLGRDFGLTYTVQIKPPRMPYKSNKRRVAIFQHFLKNSVANLAGLGSEYLCSGYQVSFSSRTFIFWETFRRWCSSWASGDILRPQAAFDVNLHRRTQRFVPSIK